MSSQFDLPDKLIYKQTEVVKFTKLDKKVLDYWQEEFGGFSPTVNQMGETFYSRVDLDFILKLKQWMVVERKSKVAIKELLKSGKPPSASAKTQSTPPVETVSNGKTCNVEKKKLKQIRSSLQEILTLLDKNGTV